MVVVMVMVMLVDAGGVKAGASGGYLGRSCDLLSCHQATTMYSRRRACLLATQTQG